MDDLAVGRLIMLARQRKQWRQADLAGAIGVSQQLVALAETGAVDRLSLRSLRRIAAPLGIRVLLNARWSGGEADRLRDRDHASLVDQVTAFLRGHGWEAAIEFTFSHFGERGSIDIIAWHPLARVLLVVEVKTRIYDVQALAAGIDRKGRLAAPLLERDRGWVATAVGRLLVVPELTANRALVERYASIFEAALPARSRQVRSWLRRPSGPLAGVWFLSSTNHIGGIQVAVGRQRVRVRERARASACDSRTTTLVGE
jgi:transcriptional regulator with XRE-family HTH domain